MDEKESLPEAQSAAVSEKVDTADSEKPSSESVQEISVGGDVPDENFDTESGTNATQSETDPELQNHVDHKVSVDTPSSTAENVDHNMSADEPTSSAKVADDSTDITNADDQAGDIKIGKFLLAF